MCQLCQFGSKWPHRGTICCHCCRCCCLFYPNQSSDFISLSFQTVFPRAPLFFLSVYSFAFVGILRLLKEGGGTLPLSPSTRPLTTVFEITVSVVEVARPLQGPGAVPPLEVRLCWPRLGRPLWVALAVGRWVWRQTLHIPAIPRT